MFKKLFLLFIFLVSISIQGKGIFQDKMKKMVKEFENIYKIESDIVPPVNIAVFSFNCDKKLQNRGIGNAVREILTHYILYEGKFKVVEREELEKIFDEWKLSLSGAIEEETAIKIGKMLGVRFIITGNITKIGKEYQITAKMTDSETGEIVISSYTNVDAKTFEEEARPYITLVPETQAIGLYFFSMLPDYSNSKYLEPDTITGTFIDSLGSHKDTVDFLFIIKSEPIRVREFSLGGGVKYFPAKWLMFDVALTGKWVDLIKGVETGEEHLHYDVYYRFNTDSLRQINGEISKVLYSALGLKFCISTPFSITRFIRIFPGLELEWYFLNLSTMTMQAPSIDYYGIDYQIFGNSLGSVRKMDNIFFLKLGLEYRPQARIGFSVSGKYRFFHDYTNRVSIYGLYQDILDGGDMVPFHITDYIDIFNFQGARYTLDFSISLYF